MSKKLKSGALEVGYRVKEMDDNILYIYPNGEIYKLGVQGYVYRKWGHLSKIGYVQIMLTTKTGVKLRYQHRLIAQVWLKDWNPNLEVDHINGIRNDNRIENLRMATRNQNNQNTTCKGYYRIEGSNSWQARIQRGNTTRTATFSTAETAKTWRHKQEQELFGEFAPDREENNASS